MKQHLLDHVNGSFNGGLIEFSAWAHPLDCDVYNGTKSEGGYNYILPEFGCGGMCSITICGFDDKVEFGGSICMNVGVCICVNSWGENWS